MTIVDSVTTKTIDTVAVAYQHDTMFCFRHVHVHVCKTVKYIFYNYFIDIVKSDQLYRRHFCHNSSTLYNSEYYQSNNQIRL